ncbi:MAG: hypothetical protein ACQEP1_00315 [Nanobdellota archaeon]
MVKFVFGPEWFFGIDSVLDIFSVLVALVIAFYSYRFYRLAGKRNYKFFALAFTLFSLAFLSKVLTNSVIYNGFLETLDLGMISLFGYVITMKEFFYIGGYLGYRLLLLLGLAGIYMVSYKKTSEMDIGLLFYLFFVVCILSHYQFIFFHITALILLGFINYFYFGNYFSKRKLTTLLIAVSFMLMFVSHALFILTHFSPLYYVVGEVVHVISFILLMGVMIVIR